MNIDDGPFYASLIARSSPLAPAFSLDEMRKIIREEVQAALHPAMPGLPDVYHFIQVEAKDQDGKKWRGILYGVEEHQ